MIKQGDVLKHERHMDVAVQVMYTSENPVNGNIWVRGIWLNQGYVKSWVINSRKFPMGIPVEFEIKPENVSQWLKCGNPTARLLRGETWTPLK